METLTLKIPDSVDEIDVKMQLAAHLFEKGILSSGQAADLGSNYKQMLKLHEYGMSLFRKNLGGPLQ